MLPQTLKFYRFYASKAKAIADKIIFDELNGVTYDEEDAKINSMNISDKVREAVNGELTLLLVDIRYDIEFYCREFRQEFSL